MPTLFSELADLFGQLRRNDYGRDTLRNVLAQASALLFGI